MDMLINCFKHGTLKLFSITISRIFIFSLLTGYLTVAFAQDKKIDSVEHLQKTDPLHKQHQISVNHHLHKHTPAEVFKPIKPSEQSEAILTTELIKKLTLLPLINGYIITDYAHYGNTNTRLGDAIELRHVFLSLHGIPVPNWGYILTTDIANGRLLMRSTYLSYLGFPQTKIKLGNFQVPFSVEDETSFRNLTFMERGLSFAFVPGYKVALDVEHYGTLLNPNHNYTFAATLFGQEVGHTTVTPGANQGFSVAARLTYAYQPSLNRLFMVGVSNALQLPDSDHHVSYGIAPESNITTIQLVSTGLLSNIKRINLSHFEVATIMGPISLQGEYIANHITRTQNKSGFTFNGWYGFASWILTGESRNYEKTTAIFAGVTPKNSYGAWEVGLRYSGINMNSDPVFGGVEHDVTLGLNWYVNSYVRFMLDYNKVFSSAKGVENNPYIVSLRGQIEFG